MDGDDGLRKQALDSPEFEAERDSTASADGRTEFASKQQILLPRGEAFGRNTTLESDVFHGATVGPIDQSAGVGAPVPGCLINEQVGHRHLEMMARGGSQ